MEFVVCDFIFELEWVLRAEGLGLLVALLFFTMKVELGVSLDGEMSGLAPGWSGEKESPLGLAELFIRFRMKFSETRFFFTGTKFRSPYIAQVLT